MSTEQNIIMLPDQGLRTPEDCQRDYLELIVRTVLTKEKTLFAVWFKRQYKVAVYFEGDELKIPERSGRSVPVIAHVAWASWLQRSKVEGMS